MVAKKYQKTNRTFIALCIKQAPIVRDVFFIIILLSLSNCETLTIISCCQGSCCTLKILACVHAFPLLFLYNKYDKYLINYSMSLE